MSVNRLCCDLHVVDAALESVGVVSVYKAEGAPVPFEVEMAGLLLAEWSTVTDETVDRVIAFLAQRQGELTEAEINAIAEEFANVIDAQMAQACDPPLRSLFDQSYKGAKHAIAQKHEIKAIFNVMDQGVVDWLGNDSVYWVGNYYNKQVSSKFTKFVGQKMQDGLGRESMGLEVKSFFDQYPSVASKPDVYWRGLAANAMNRSRNFGVVQSYVDVGVTELEILAVMDERTSPICRAMNGKVFPVKKAISQRNAMMAAQNPEDVKNISPWVGADAVAGKSSEEIAALGVVLPPYHFHCRTTVVER